MNMTKQEIINALPHYHGSETFVRYNNSILTEGAKFIADECEAYWLMDLICSHQYNPKVRKEPFQVFKLSKNKNNSGATVIIENGNNLMLDLQGIPFTDFPLDEIILWRVNETIMLPSEY